MFMYILRAHFTISQYTLLYFIIIKTITRATSLPQSQIVHFHNISKMQKFSCRNAERDKEQP